MTTTPAVRIISISPFCNLINTHWKSCTNRERRRERQRDNNKSTVGEKKQSDEGIKLDQSYIRNGEYQRAHRDENPFSLTWILRFLLGNFTPYLGSTLYILAQCFHSQRQQSLHLQFVMYGAETKSSWTFSFTIRMEAAIVYHNSLLYCNYPLAASLRRNPNVSNHVYLSGFVPLFFRSTTIHAGDCGWNGARDTLSQDRPTYGETNYFASMSSDWWETTTSSCLALEWYPSGVRKTRMGTHPDRCAPIRRKGCTSHRGGPFGPIETIPSGCIHYLPGYQ